MTHEKPIPTPLAEEDLARIDTLASLHRVTRDEMFARILNTGLLAEERQAREARVRSKGGAS